MQCSQAKKCSLPIPSEVATTVLLTCLASTSVRSTVVDDVKCAVCEQTIVDGKDQALFCDGVCKGWYHRYCAGVSLPHFQRLSTSSLPFFCMECFQARCNKEVYELKSSVSTLKDEVALLRVAVEENSKGCNCASASHHPTPMVNGYSQPTEHGESNNGMFQRSGGTRGRGLDHGRGEGRARAGRMHGSKYAHENDLGKNGEGMRGAREWVSSLGGGGGGTHNSPSDAAEQHQSQKVCVEGARRVWGTMSVTTTSSLKFTIGRFSPTDSLLIKRKTICNSAGEVKRWWFVLHDSEEALRTLADKWDNIQMQTGWKLELCYKPHPNVNTTPGAPINVLPINPSSAEESANATMTNEQHHLNDDVSRPTESTIATSTAPIAPTPTTSPFLGN